MASIASNKGTCEPVPRNSVNANKITHTPTPAAVRAARPSHTFCAAVNGWAWPNYRGRFFGFMCGFFFSFSSLFDGFLPGYQVLFKFQNFFKFNICSDFEKNQIQKMFLF
jgi:hypothetical protein